jgi:hypothetical protein
MTSQHSNDLDFLRDLGIAGAVEFSRRRENLSGQFGWSYWPDGTAWFCAQKVAGFAFVALEEHDGSVNEPLATVRPCSGEWRWEVTGDRHHPTYADTEPSRGRAIDAAERELLLRELLRPHRI